MPSAFTHAFVAGALVAAAPRGIATWKLGLVGAGLAVLPDLDVAAFRLGIDYGHPLGHRGVSHSLSFAAFAGMLALVLCFRELRPGTRRWWTTGLVLCACAASHGVLDAFTDAGRGVGFFIPFDDARYFFPWRPLATSPLSIGAFFDGPAQRILRNEITWVWLPCLALVVGVRGLRRLR